MNARSDVSPSTVGVSLVEHGVEVEYLDGRTAIYRGVPEPVEGTLRTAPGKDTHVLVTDPTGTEGVIVYVNDRNTHDDVLRQSGVGRVLLAPGESTELFPGVSVRRTDGRRCEVDADPDVARGRVFVFVEDEFGEQSFEMVAGGDEGGAGDDRSGDAGVADADGDRAGGDVADVGDASDVDPESTP
jgi:hypothetical protein